MANTYTYIYSYMYYQQNGVRNDLQKGCCVGCVGSRLTSCDWGFPLARIVAAAG